MKFNSKTFNCGDKEYHKRNYYTNVDDAEIAKTAGKIEEQLLTDFFKAWTDAGRPVRGWEFRSLVQRKTRGGSRIPRWRGANPPGEGAPTYDFATFVKKLHEIEKFLDRRGACTRGVPPNPPLTRATTD